MTRRATLAALLLCAIPAAAQVPPPPQTATASAACAATCAVAVATSGFGQVAAQATGTGTGLTFAFQGTLDNGTTWQTLPAATTGATPGWVVTASANGLWLVPAAGMQQVRVNLTAISTGTETFSLSASVPANVRIP